MAQSLLINPITKSHAACLFVGIGYTGGTIRDMVLGHYPIGWTQHPGYVYLVISAGLLTTVVARYLHRIKRVFLLKKTMT